MKNEFQAIILFDGVCNLCNASVQFILKRDSKAQFRFASLQSEFGKQKLLLYEIDANKCDSVIYIYKDKAFIKSTAALQIAKKLGGGWPLLYGLIIIPRFIRDWVYGFIAKNRYRWFGKKDSCMIPSPELKSRFLG